MATVIDLVLGCLLIVLIAWLIGVSLKDLLRWFRGKRHVPKSPDPSSEMSPEPSTERADEVADEPLTTATDELPSPPLSTAPESPPACHEPRPRLPGDAPVSDVPAVPAPQFPVVREVPPQPLPRRRREAPINPATFPGAYPVLRRRRSRQKRAIDRPERNIETAKRVLKRLAEFDGEYREARIMAYLRKINPYVFEEVVLTAYERQGRTAIRNPSYSGDGGVDGRVIDKSGRVMLVQAKRYSSAIDPAHVAAFSALIEQTEGVSMGLFVHTGRTGEKSRDARGVNVRFISGKELVNLLVPTSANR